MGKILIVEDELLISDHISRILNGSGYSANSSVTNYHDAILAIEEDKPEIVLTDIMLSGNETGVDLGNLLYNKYKIPFVYITSHFSAEMIAKAKYTCPNAYLVKPFKKEDLLIAIELAIFNSGNSKPKEQECLTIKDGHVVAQIQYSDIVWLESEGNYTLLNTNNLKKRMVRSAISDLHKQLPENDFIRIHRSYVVNRRAIIEFSATHVMVNGTKIPIGRTYRDNLAEAMKTL